MFKIWIKGLPMPEGSEDMGVEGICINTITQEIRCTFSDEIPENIKKQLKKLPPTSHRFETDIQVKCCQCGTIHAYNIKCPNCGVGIVWWGK